MGRHRFYQETNWRIYFVCLFTLHSKQIKFIRLCFGRIYGSLFDFIWPLVSLPKSDLLSVANKTQIWIFKSWIWNSKMKYHRVSLEHNEAGCHARPNKRVYHSLNDICTQCSNLYGDNYGELYTLCRYVCLCMDISIDGRRTLFHFFYIWNQ